MNKEDLKLIETELQIVLPDFYKSIIIKNPFSDVKSYFAVYKLLLNDANEIIETNNHYRSNGFGKKKWPNYYMIIGKISDSIYFIDITRDETIYSLSSNDRFSEKNIIKHKANDNFNEYIKSLKRLQSIHNNP